MKRKALITSISGTILSQKESNLFKTHKPWGIILFKRNIVNFNQTKKLIKSIQNIFNDKNYPILIDEEGGTVCRLTTIFDNKAYSQNFFGKLYKKNKNLGYSFYENYIYSLSSVLKKLGININTVPVLDILKKNTHRIIKSRTYSDDIKIIKILGKLCIRSYKKNKIGTVIKHIPGHGSASSDSHKTLPIVRKNHKNLIKNDFKSFKGMKSHFAMTAHILFSYIDSKNAVTHSSNLIRKIIRKQIGFRGILISDDISMKALKYGLIENAKRSLSAGCNLALYCSGKYHESKRLLKELPLIDNFTMKKTSQFYKFLR
tara:strand:- start:321 stop:1268 length:948 start_codon:yes stop_codon:yes gene_type:complete